MDRRAYEVVETIAERQAEQPRERDRRRVLVGLVGRGIGASRSPVMHQLEGDRLGLRYDYALLDFDADDLHDSALADVVAAAETAGFAGLNVTHPFKQRIINVLTDLSPEAAAVGAVNTVVFANGRRTGHNTDSFGFAESFRRDMAGCRLGIATMFGAGGGGAAVAHALLQLGIGQLRIVDAVSARAEALAERFSVLFGARVEAAANAADAIAGADGVVNATPLGMNKYPGTPFDPALLAASQWLADIVYFPEETELLIGARRAGCRTLSGRGMAVFQAAKAFALFTGLDPDWESMTRHFEATGMNEVVPGDVETTHRTRSTSNGRKER